MKLTAYFFLLGVIALTTVQAETLSIGGCTMVPGTHCPNKATELKYKDLKNLTLNDSDFSFTSFHGSSLDGSDLRYTNLEGAEFDMGSIAGADLRGANLTDAYLTLARVHNADMRGARLFNVDLRYAEGANTLKLEGALLCNTRLPDGTLSNQDCP